MRGVFITAFFIHYSAPVSAVADLAQYVNPFIGTEGPIPNSGANSGDVFPGVTVPFGVVKLGPDTTEFDPSTNAFAGYTPDGKGM